MVARQVRSLEVVVRVYIGALLRVWRNGSRSGLKIHCLKGRVGSNPTTRTPPQGGLLRFSGMVVGRGSLSGVFH